MNKVTLHKIAVDPAHDKTSENEMEVVSIHLTPTTVATFPANDISDDGKTTYKDRYAPLAGLAPLTDAERIEQLEAQVAERDQKIADLEGRQDYISHDTDNPDALHQQEAANRDALVS